MGIIDPELTARIGRVDARTAKAVEEEATQAFFRGLAEPTALDLARGLHWIALGHPRLCSSEHIIDVLSDDPLSLHQRQRLSHSLDAAYTLSYERQSHRIPIVSRQPLHWLEVAMLGWHISLALELLNYDGLMQAPDSRPGHG